MWKLLRHSCYTRFQNVWNPLSHLIRPMIITNELCPLSRTPKSWSSLQFFAFLLPCFTPNMSKIRQYTPLFVISSTRSWPAQEKFKISSFKYKNHVPSYNLHSLLLLTTRAPQMGNRMTSFDPLTYLGVR